MSWIVSYRKANSHGGKGYDKMEIINDHPAVWIANENRYHEVVLRVYSAIEILPEDEERVREKRYQSDF